MPKSVQINVWLDEDLAQRLRDRASIEERSMGAVARMAIKSWLGESAPPESGPVPTQSRADAFRRATQRRNER